MSQVIVTLADGGTETHSKAHVIHSFDDAVMVLDAKHNDIEVVKSYRPGEVAGISVVIGSAVIG